MIACSENYSMVLSQEGTAYGFGCNWNGEVGSGSTEYQLTKPELVQCELPFEFIALYGHLSIGLTRTGLCYIWGEVKNEDVLVPRLTEMTSILEAMSDYTMLTYTPHLIQVKYKFQRAIPVSISIASSFDQEELSDLKVTVGDKSILVHRSILRITSCYFRKMLSEVWSKTDEIKIDSYSFPVYYAYLRFLYTDTLLIDRDYAQELFDLSVSFMEHDLRLACLTLLVSNLSIENCCHLYKLSAHYEFPAQFHRTILDFIACNIRQVQQTDTFKSFAPEQAEQLSNELEL